jgi:hypothetical protein
MSAPINIKGSLQRSALYAEDLSFEGFWTQGVLDSRGSGLKGFLTKYLVIRAALDSRGSSRENASFAEVCIRGVS